MTFASAEFAVLLCCILGLYYFLPQRGRMLLLLVASYIFYCYWNPLYGLLILGSTLIDYCMALAIQATDNAKKRKLALLASVCGNLGILGYFKYTDFALDSLKILLGPLGANLPGPLGLILPIGISFYTFQTMSYTIDVYRREKEAEKDFLLVALYVAFFPQLVAGPIERAKKLMPQLLQRQPFTFENLEQGIRLILWGLLKKIVVADRLIHAAYPAFLDPGSFTTGELVFSASGMLVALYLDFSAYSEIARGVARLFGIRLSINFNFPHTATNAADYWRRWHMTMSSWVHDYLFVPLGGFHPRHFWRHTRITLITMGLVGLWHGAAWNFIFWGLGHGLYLIIYQIIRLKILRKYRKHVFFMSLPWRFGSWCFNIATRVLIGVCFFAPDFSRLKIFLYRILIQPDLAGFNKPSILLGLGIIISFWIFHYLRSKSDMQKHIDTWNPMLRGAGYAFLIYLILFGAVDTAEQFIYYQF